MLALVAAGRTNKAIADALYVSPNTIKSHVTSLLTKMHADSRVQLAAIAVRQGLSDEGGTRLRESPVRITHVQDAIVAGDRQTHGENLSDGRARLPARAGPGRIWPRIGRWAAAPGAR